MQGVLLRASFRCPPLSGQENYGVVSTFQQHFCQEEGIANKLITTIRAIMIGQQIDVIPMALRGDVAAETTSVLSMTPVQNAAGPQHCGNLVRFRTTGADGSGFLKTPGSDRCWRVRMHGTISHPSQNSWRTSNRSKMPLT